MSTNGKPQELPEPTGGGGALFTRTDNIRSDAKLAAQMISLGVISLEQAENLLRAGFTLATRSAVNNDARGYSACMKIALEVAKLSQNERHKVLDKQVPDLMHVETSTQSVSRQAILSDPEYLEFREQQRLRSAVNGQANGHKNGNGHV